MAEQGPGVVRRVLVAGYNDMNRAMVEAALGRMGVTVESSADPLRAADAVRARNFDLVLLDLPDAVADSLAALRRIRAVPGDRGLVPVVVLCNLMKADDRFALIAEGADGFLRKPLNWPALAGTIQALAAMDDLPLRRSA
ncbi:response regulator [Arenibaculum pallidiluteum]|uniref:response regulator n=1 Tax=Arenibaculum pallidiluteum TaxID=2812559 RepID=UPI001A95C85E|nr:response regulator [Arenibaculum pallidiluteum]